MGWINGTPSAPAISLYTQGRTWIDRFKHECRADLVSAKVAIVILVRSTVGLLGWKE